MTQTETEYANLTPWSHPRDYGGQTWYGWFAVYSQNRDSDALERSNYRCILEELQKLSTDLTADAIDPRQGDYNSPEDPTVCDTRVSHWGPGWVEIIYVHSSNTTACEAANQILTGLEDYGVYDETDFSAEESNDEEESWSNVYRSEFTTALENSFRVWLDDRFYAGGLDPESKEGEARIEAIMELFEDIDFDNLFRDAADSANVYWEHASDGASIDTQRVADSITNEELLELCGENESVFRPRRFCPFDPFQMWFDFVLN